MGKNVCVDILMEAEKNTPGLPQTPEGFPVFERKPCSGGQSGSMIDKSCWEK